MSPLRRYALIALCWTALGAAALSVRDGLVIRSDLRSFMPPARAADQRLVTEEIGNGPGAQLLLLAIGNAAPPQLARLSAGLAAALRTDPRFTRVLNGAEDVTSLDPALLPYRYLLSPTLDTARFDAAFLAAELEQREEDLATPGIGVLDDLLARDPTLEVLKLGQRWRPAHVPQVREGVWFSPQGEALLLAQTRAPGFDPAAQAGAIEALRRDFDGLPDAGAAQLTVSGPGYFAAAAAKTTRDEAERLSAIGVLGFALLLVLAYRSAGILAVVALPLAAGALGGLAAIGLTFGGVHGITLAFGFTLLGVAQEYPIRLFSHRRAGATVAASTADVWPLLRLAIVSACIAYLALAASGVPGLQQLALFTITGLLIAGAVTRWLLPEVVPLTFDDVAASPWLERLRARLAHMPRPRPLPWLVLAGALTAVSFAPTPAWQNDLAALAPIPQAQLQREGELRAALGAPDVRYLLVLEAASADGVLRLSEAIAPLTGQWMSRGIVDDIELPSRYLPSLATQRARQERLPDRATLTTALDAALADRDFQPGLFAPFVDDVETARSLPLLTPDAFMHSPFGARLQAMLVQRDGRWFGLAAVHGVRDAQELERGVRAAHGGDVRLLDLKTSSEALVADCRERILVALGAALALLAAAVAVAFRDARRAWHVIAPMSLATLAVVAVLRACGVSLSLFHLVALTLAAGLGLHYALFFERPVSDAAEARRTLHATLVCVISAVLVFGLLATSALPVLRAIGVTVALGVAFHFCLSTQMAQRRDR